MEADELGLVSDSNTPVVPDTDFEFLSDSEATPAGELRTLLHGKVASPIRSASPLDGAEERPATAPS